MAISEGTLQSLQVLRDITYQGVAEKEAEKSRAANIAQSRIAADERRLERMSQRLERLNEIRMETANKYTELTGLQANIQKKRETDGITGSDALGFINGIKMDTLDEQDAVESQMAETQSSIDMLNQRVAGYHEAYKVLAPREYEQYRASSGDTKSIYGKSFVQGEEMNNLIATIEKKQGRALSQEQRSGLATRLEEMGKERFGMFLDEAKLNLGYANLKASRAGNEQELERKRFVDRYKQWRDATLGLAQRAGLDTEFTATIPDVLTSVQDISKVADTFLDEIGRIAYQGLDEGIFSGDTRADLAKDINAWKDAYDEHQMDAARDAAANIARKLLVEGRTRELDFSMSPFSEGSEKQDYMRRLVEGMPILEDYTDNVALPGMGDELFLKRAKRAQEYLKLDEDNKGKDGDKTPPKIDDSNLKQWFYDTFFGSKDPFTVPKDKKLEFFTPEKWGVKKKDKKPQPLKIPSRYKDLR